MNSWKERPLEIANLFNPAFCSYIIYITLQETIKLKKSSVPIAILYLILPLLLNKKILANASTKVKMHVWIQENQSLFIDFSEQVRDFIEITNESIEYLLKFDLIYINNLGEFQLKEKKKMNKEAEELNEEILEIKKNVKKIARWFSLGSTKAIYISLGVRP